MTAPDDFSPGGAAPAGEIFPPYDPAPEWFTSTQRNRDGWAIPNLANAMMALRGDSTFVDAFAFDRMAARALLLRPLIDPRGELMVDDARPFPRALTDDDVSAVTEWLQLQAIPNIRTATVHEAISLRAKEQAFHPVQQYLQRLKWDGEYRLESWLSAYMKAEDIAYSAGIGFMFFVALVARVMNPGCQCDYMLILEGPQGLGKSSACSIIGGEWFSDSLPDQVASKDASQHLRGKWLIEVAELQAMSKSDTAALKGFITRRVERYRPPHGRLEVDEPRQCVFVGTTNASTYLKDETGARRYWPVRVGVEGPLDLEGLRRDRDQLFAEAMVRFRDGERWWPSSEFEERHARPQQEARYEGDPWEEAIEAHLRGAGGLAPIQRVTVLELARSALGLDATMRLGTADQRRITAILTRLGWERRKSNGERPWVKGASHVA
jgi:predicted P-loop ATPase